MEYFMDFLKNAFFAYLVDDEQILQRGSLMLRCIVVIFSTLI